MEGIDNGAAQFPQKRQVGGFSVAQLEQRTIGGSVATRCPVRKSG
jgi:hypothetical protein